MKRAKRTAAVVMLLIFAAFGLGAKDLRDILKGAVDQPPVTVMDRFKERSPRRVKYKLENGLTVVVEENFAAPVAAVQVWVKTGAADETDKEAGLAHLLEHMVFKGTQSRPVGAVAREVESFGGDLNAFTSSDQTVYHITSASRFFGNAVEILSDLVRNATVNGLELAREREVVLEEIRRGKDNPRSRIYKYLSAEAYRAHPYRRPVIGFEETVSNFSRDDVVGFYRKWYVPRNMTVVVTGKVLAEDVLAAVRKNFGDMKDEKLPSLSPRETVEPVQDGFRTKVYREEVSEGYMYMGFHIPAFGADDMAALDVLSVIMGGGETSRLTYRIRTERRLVSRIFAYANTPRDPGMFMVGLDLVEDNSAKAMEAILQQLYLLKHEPVAAWELERAKLVLGTDSIYARETVDGQARRIGFFVTMTGDPDYEQRYLQRVREVKPEDLMRVARKYFRGSNLTVSAIFPAKAGRKTRKLDEAGMQAIALAADAWDENYQPGELVESNPINPPQVPDAAAALSFSAKPVAMEPQRFELSNGIRLIVRENHSVPLVSLRAAYAAGLRMENSENNGINNFIAETITEGTAHYEASQVHSIMESRAGSISGFAGRNSMGVTLEVPSAYYRDTLPVLADVLRYPTFPEEEVDRRRDIILSTINSQMDQPHILAMRFFRSELFHDHPFGMDVLGVPASIEGMSADDLRDYYQNFAVPNNLVIAVVGDVKPEEVRRQFEELFGDWVADPYETDPVALEPAPAEPREIAECRDFNQANLIVGFQGTRISAEDRYAVAVMNAVLSGMSGRLFSELREKQSLCYSVQPFHEEGVDPGFLGVSIGTAPEKEQQARSAIMTELKRLRTEPVTDAELRRAKELLIGDFEIGLQRFGSQAGNYALDELYGLGYKSSSRYVERIQAVTKSDIQRVAQKYLKTEAAVVSVIHPCASGQNSGGEEAGTSQGTVR